MLYLRAGHETHRCVFNRADKLVRLERWCLLKLVRGAKEVKKEREVDGMCMKEWVARYTLKSSFCNSDSTRKLSYCTTAPKSIANPLFSYIHQFFIQAPILRLKNCIPNLKHYNDRLNADSVDTEQRRGVCERSN